MDDHPGAAAPLPLEGAPPAAWQSQFRGGRLDLRRTLAVDGCYRGSMSSSPSDSAVPAPALSAPGRAALAPLPAALMIALLLGLQPVLTDLYLPTLPLIARDFAAPLSAMQMTMSALILAFGLMQLVWGPLADRYGRRPVLLASLSLMVAASVGAVLAQQHRRADPLARGARRGARRDGGVCACDGARPVPAARRRACDGARAVGPGSACDRRPAHRRPAGRQFRLARRARGGGCVCSGRHGSDRVAFAGDAGRAQPAGLAGTRARAQRRRGARASRLFARGRCWWPAPTAGCS